MSWMIKNSAGKKDAMLTLALIAFGTVVAKVLVSGLVLSIAGHDVNFGDVDGAAIAALLTPTLGAYVARRHSETKYGQPDADADDQNGDGAK